MNQNQTFSLAATMVIAFCCFGAVEAQEDKKNVDSRLQQQITATEMSIQETERRIDSIQKDIEEAEQQIESNEVDAEEQRQHKAKAESAKIEIETSDKLIQSLQIQRVETLVDRAGVQARLKAFENKLRTGQSENDKSDPEHLDALRKILAIRVAGLERSEAMFEQGDVSTEDVEAKRVLMIEAESALEEAQRIGNQNPALVQLEQMFAIQKKEMNRIEKLYESNLVSTADLDKKRLELLETQLRMEKARKPSIDPRLEAQRLELFMSSAELEARLEMIDQLLTEIQSKKDYWLGIIASYYRDRQRADELYSKLNSLGGQLRMENQSLNFQKNELKQLQDSKEQR